jgi:hypothetical protein
MSIQCEISVTAGVFHMNIYQTDYSTVCNQVNRYMCMYSMKLMIIVEKSLCRTEYAQLHIYWNILQYRQLEKLMHNLPFAIMQISDISAIKK